VNLLFSKQDRRNIKSTRCIQTLFLVLVAVINNTFYKLKHDIFNYNVTRYKNLASDASLPVAFCIFTTADKCTREQWEWLSSPHLENTAQEEDAYDSVIMKPFIKESPCQIDSFVPL
jgi:hypothetical protein